eukprot:TRINITY_DN1164_c0_g1_i1.p2 TRINITY_DN1164_c0_g1~~TRINITY_DN1164_c0_g1_i1.p2  ORF type:complete len:59 (-),score=0.91 TRINITY_DN1164_c0_g1_i1:95-271(-)
MLDLLTCLVYAVACRTTSKATKRFQNQKIQLTQSALSTMISVWLKKGTKRPRDPETSI